MKHRNRGKRIGVLVPFTNTNLEQDMILMKPDGISLHFGRMGGYEADEIPDETQMQNLGASDLDEPLQLLCGVDPDVVMYGCTSATLSHGPDFDRNLAETIEKQSNAKTVTAAGGLVNALKVLNASRIGFASPYVPAINNLATDFLSRMGFEIVKRSEFDHDLGNEEQGALTPDDVYRLGLGADCDDAEIVVLSCTDMRSVETIAKLEDTIGKPVISSNQAMLFQALQFLEISQPVKGFGKLLELHRL